MGQPQEHGSEEYDRNQPAEPDVAGGTGDPEPLRRLTGLPQIKTCEVGGSV